MAVSSPWWMATVTPRTASTVTSPVTKEQALLGYSMGSYALGYFSPPLPPGEGPEGVPPQFALGTKVPPGWGEEMYAAINERLRAKLKA